MTDVYAVCSGEYDDFHVDAVYLHEEDADKAAAAANEIEGLDADDYMAYRVQDYPLGASPMVKWRRDPDGMHGCRVSFVPLPAKRDPKWRNTVTGTDRDEVEALYQSRTEEEK